MVKAGLIEFTQTHQGISYTIRGLCCRGAGKNVAKNVTPNAANDVSQEINPATDATLIAENNADFAESAATDVTSNARSDIDPATDAALNAGNNADFTKNPATDVETIAMAKSFFDQVGVKNIKLVINSLGDSETRERYREALIGYLEQHLDSLRRKMIFIIFLIIGSLKIKHLQLNSNTTSSPY